ncbi:MAG: hypothetical protein ACXWT3_14320 [Methylococcaceae bacterium]
MLEKLPRAQNSFDALSNMPDALKIYMDGISNLLIMATPKPIERTSRQSAMTLRIWSKKLSLLCGCYTNLIARSVFMSE